MEQGNDIVLRKTIYNNGISVKSKERRVTVVKTDVGFTCEIKRLTDKDEPCCKHTHSHGMTITSISISKISAVILMNTLAEMMGYKLLPDYELDFCEKCYQMTNHFGGICQKCKDKKE